jgi:hypothetical protein
MNNNLEFEYDDKYDPNCIEDNHPRTNYGAGFGEKIYSKVKLKQLLEDYTNRIVENAKAKGGGVYKTNEGFLESNPICIDKESITSQLPLFLKELT